MFKKCILHNSFSNLIKAFVINQQVRSISTRSGTSAIEKFDFELAKRELSSELEKKSKIFFKIFEHDSFHPLPFALNQWQLNEFQKLQESIYLALKSIVSNYNNDIRIKDVYRFSPKINQILQLYQHKPYLSVGSYRPDFLYESDSYRTRFRICEINARFPCNAYFITDFGSNLILNLEQAKSLTPHLTHIDSLAQVLECFKNEFDLTKPIGIIKNKEYGYDIHLFKHLVTNTYFIKPNELILRPCKSKISLKHRNADENQESKEIEIDQFLIELHQHEILSLPIEILAALVNSSKLLNDLRTIFIGHDKRFLTILSRDDILSDYLDEKHHDTIRKHRIHSILASDLLERHANALSLRKEICENRSEWVLKPCLLGKGEGIIFGKNLTDQNWANLVDQAANSNDFIFQKYLTQHKFDLELSQSQLERFGTSQLNLVGTLLCLNDKFLGPGVYRAGKKDLIALSQGGFFVYPVLEKPRQAQFKNHQQLIIPENSIFELNSFSFKDANLYKKSLLKHGLVLINLHFIDHESNYFLALINCLGMDACSHTINNTDVVWHIKPNLANNSEGPRSQRSTIFTMHTDASFESVPPRYFGLQVFRSDSFGGGKTLLMKVKDILKKLEQHEIELLKTVNLTFEKPLEFRKKCQTISINGTILSPKTDVYGNTLMRYRHDILRDIETTTTAHTSLKPVLAKLERIIDVEKSVLIKTIDLKENQLLLVDNSTWLHGRTKIMDPHRHLVRVRFQTRIKDMLPW